MRLHPLLMTVLILPLFLLGMMTPGVTANRRPTVVVFTANWCASCRSLVPMVRDIASQNGLAYQEVDVDSQNAPSVARSQGLSIPSGNLPQAFLVNNSSVTPLLTGAPRGGSDAVRASVLENLQRGLR